MSEINISELSVGDWIAIESAQLAIECNDIATAFVDKVKKPIQIVSVLGAEQLVFGRIEEIDGFTTIYLKAEHIEPIPLTPEILEKNRFVKNGEYNEWNIGTWETSDLIGVSLERPSIIVKHLGTSIFLDQAKHTHQLQHALRLAGVEKEIEV